MTSKPDLAAVLEHYGLNTIDKHGWVACKCIIHDDALASAAYNLDTQGYNCLVCNIIGDVYTVVQSKEGLGFADAKRRAETIANGRSHKVFNQSNTTGSLLPRRAGNQSGSGKYIPAWKRNRS